MDIKLTPIKAAQFWAYAAENRNSIARTILNLPLDSGDMSIEGNKPDIKDFQSDPRCFIEAYKAWTYKCYSYFRDDIQGIKYPHHVKFSLIKRNNKDADQPPHTSVIQAKRFYQSNDESVDVAFEIIYIPHTLISSSSSRNENQLHYLDDHLYYPFNIEKIYEAPFIEDVTGMNLTRYTIKPRQFEGQELNVLALEVLSADNESVAHPEPGRYDIISLENPWNPYIYSTGSQFFLTSHVQACVTKINSDFFEDYTFHYVLRTPHKIKLKKGIRTNDPSGFFKAGLYRKNKDHWESIDKNFKIIKERPLLQLSHPTDVHFIEELICTNEHSNASLINDINAFSELFLVKGLNFSGCSFNENDQKLLINLLKKMNGIESLNISKKEDELSYKSLITYLLTLTNLKKIDITGCTISDDLREKLFKKSGLTVVPQHAVIIPESVPVPVPVVEVAPIGVPAPKPPRVVSTQIITISSDIHVEKRSVGKTQYVTYVKSYKNLVNIYSDGRQVTVKSWWENSLK